MTDTINGRTLDEIKKALQCRVKGCSEKCDHRCDMCELYVPNYRLEDRYSDALAYIQQLESRLAQVERERDAAIVDMRSMAVGDICKLCARMDEGYIPMPTRCKYANDDDCFRWRGICSENTKKPFE